MFKIAFTLLLFVSLVFSNVYVANPITIGLLANIIMLLFCLREKIPFPNNKRIKTFNFFLLCFLLTSLLYGYIDMYFKGIINGYFCSFVWIWATVILSQKYSASIYLIVILLVVALINSIFVIAQYMGQPLAFFIPQILNVAGGDKIDSIIDKQGKTDLVLAMMGLMGTVKSGYYLGIGAVLSTYLASKVKPFISLPVWGCIMLGLFLLGERAALISAFLFSMFMFWRNFVSLSVTSKLIIVVLFLSLILFNMENIDLNFQSYIQGTRYESFALDERSDIYSKSFDYILSNPLGANLFDFFYKYDVYPHHLIYNSFIYGTIIGGCAILVLLVVYIKKAVGLVFRKLTDDNCLYVAFAAAFLTYCLISTTHNASIVSGDVLFWLLIIPVIDYYNKTKYIEF